VFQIVCVFNVKRARAWILSLICVVKVMVFKFD